MGGEGSIPNRRDARLAIGALPLSDDQAPQRRGRGGAIGVVERIPQSVEHQKRVGDCREDAAEAILAYLPFADDETIFDELQSALNSVAYPKGKAHPSLLKALADKQPVRRAAAAVTLAENYVGLGRPSGADGVRQLS